MQKLVVFKIGEGSFEQGFPVTLQIGEEGKPPVVEVRGRVPPDAKIPDLYYEWQSKYKGDRQITVDPSQTNNYSREEECKNAASALEKCLQEWFDQSSMQKLRAAVLTEVNKETDEARIVLQTQNVQLQKLPWHLWDLLESLPRAEIVLGSKYAPAPSRPLSNPVKILAILGNAEGIDIEEDKKALSQLRGASVTLLELPQRKELNEHLWNKPWDILFFAGHSSSWANADNTLQGAIQINDRESLSLDELRYALKEAVKNGLKLAIFNSCDGLGLLAKIADLGIPSAIAMREAVPDNVAQEFLRYFLTTFSQGKSLHQAVRIAREKLQGMETESPCASWLPVICQNPAAGTLTWPQPQHLPVKIGAGLLAGLAVASIAFIVPNSILLKCAQEQKTFTEFADCDKIPFGIWQYGGSTSWAAIRETAEQKIKAELPKFQITYKQDPLQPPSSGNGIKMLIEGRLAFAQSSTPVTNEAVVLANQRGFTLKQIPVAYDAIVAAVHPSFNIKGLTVEQLVGIYKGKYRNWREIGGPDLTIKPYATQGSGGPTIVKGYFLSGEYFGNNITFARTPSEAISKVGNPDNEIEKGGIYIASAKTLIGQCSLKTLKIAKDRNSEFVAAYEGELIPAAVCPKQRNQINREAIRTNQYPLVRQIYVVVRQDGSIETKAGEAYASLLLTEEGQQLIQDAGFMPMRFIEPQK
ncbi:substrate-binding domain-containing protein [Microseira sp. BLCC-F43]|jgi:ABC-type phosphate transport system substrate-binding protein|uniref:substrate-binding domain-containing protein n=1 Tax=Microseira sp. BLCC-F43 TaxID=3153602 RepID=UPI0035B8BA92